MLSASDIAMQCRDAREQGDGWQCCCPAHDDTHASLSIHDGEKGVVLYCHAGCEFAAILEALAIPATDVFYEASPHSNQNGKPRRKQVATYDYIDAYGTLLYQAVRYEPKDFRQRRPHPEYIDEWIDDLKDVERVLYRLPEVLKAEQVLAVEGESDVERLRVFGYVATTAAMGARKRWPKDYAAMWQEPLRGKDVVLLPDNDEPGLAHMSQAAKFLQGVARSVRLLILPGLPDKGDVSDWLNAGHTAQELAALIDSAPLASALSATTTRPREPPKPLSPQGQLNTRYVGKDLLIGDDADAWRGGLIIGKNGEPTENIGNVLLLLRHLKAADVLWWDSFSMGMMLGDVPLTEADHVFLAAQLSATFAVPINRMGNLAKCLHALAQERGRDPLREYIEGLAWDGTARLETWAETYLRADDTPLSSWIGTTLCCAMVARALTPGCQQRYVVIFEGHENAGKSKACDILGGRWYDAITSNFDAKEAIINLRGCWLVEVEELNAMRKSEEAAVKAFVTRRRDRITLKYANEPTTYERRTILVGTVNPHHEGYLKGVTGDDDTRYLPINVGQVDAEGLIAVRDQLFAEAKHKLGEGYRWWEVPAEVDEALKSERGERRESNIYAGTIKDWLNGWQKLSMTSADRPLYVTTTEVMTRALGILEKEKWASKALQMQVASGIRIAGWKRKQIRNDEQDRQWIWEPPPPERESDLPF